MSAKKVDRIAQGLEAAKATYNAGLDSLRTTAGQPVFAPDEEQRRRQEFESTYRTAQQAAETALEDVRAVAQQEIDGATVGDPLTRLQSSELDKARQLQPFISEDFQRLPASALARQVQEALDSDDKIRRALARRYGRQALQTRFSAPGEAVELRQALSKLEETFTDQTKRTAAEETLKAAGTLTTSMVTERYLSQAYGVGAVRGRKSV